MGKDSHDDVYSHPNLPRETINAFIGRVKNPNGGHWENNGERRKIESLLENPSTTKADVKKLIAKGSADAVKDPRADEQDVRDYWNKTDKSLEPARDILKAKNIPPDILRERRSTIRIK